MIETSDLGPPKAPCVTPYRTLIDLFRDHTVRIPWGRLGILICSDTYHGLIPRITALRGPDLLLVPANRPPAGLDPRKHWQARVLENGLYLAACNRTGLDRGMDCRPVTSCLVVKSVYLTIFL